MGWREVGEYNVEEECKLISNVRREYEARRDGPGMRCDRGFHDIGTGLLPVFNFGRV